MTLAVDAETISEPVAKAATASENLITLLGGIWLTVGLFIDGYAHANIIDAETEDFLTPWHGLFYSGFLFTAGWIGWLMYRRRTGEGVRTWIPSGYGWAVAGIIAFAVGGVGDGIWHTVFGVEVGLDALLSPTHLLLLYGLVLILASPLQAVLATGGSTWVGVASITILALLAAFFTSFARPLGRSWALEIGFNPRSGNDIWASWMVGGVLLTTAIMMVAALYLLQHFDHVPFGAITVLWALPAILEAIALSSTIASAAAGGLIGGLVADLGLLRLHGSARFVWSTALCAGVLATWCAWTLTQHLRFAPISVPAEIWTGQIVMSAFIALALVRLATPPSAQRQQRP